MTSCLLKMVFPNYLFTNHKSLYTNIPVVKCIERLHNYLRKYIYKQNLALNNILELISYKTQPNNHHCVDTGCHFKDLLRVMGDRDI